MLEAPAKPSFVQMSIAATEMRLAPVVVVISVEADPPGAIGASPATATSATLVSADSSSTSTGTPPFSDNCATPFVADRFLLKTLKDGSWLATTAGVMV
jgi:hypothetical protein